MTTAFIQKPRIVAVLGKDALVDILAAGDADMIELRMDLVSNNPLKTIRALRKATTKPIIATNRYKAEGGGFQGSERERCDQLVEAAPYADYVDIELHSRVRDELIKRVKKPVIVSYHDFKGTPSQKEMASLLKDMKLSGAAIGKIAITPTSLKDNLQILDFLLEADMPLCVIAMGDLGRHLRAVAPLYGSVLTYGYVSDATAPGQMKVEDLKMALNLLEGNDASNWTDHYHGKK